MKRITAVTLLGFTLFQGLPAAGAPPIADLVQKLSQSSDFRVRVQAALELGKARSRESCVALEAGLDDENAAVRAASAAALKVQADPAAMSALVEHENDSSAAVRAQIQSSLASLRAAEASASKPVIKTELIVQVGKIRSGAASTSGAVLEDVARTSKRKLRELPGVAVVEADERDERHSSKTPAAHGALPVVMMTGRVKKLEESREGKSVVCLASIEFVLHRMPGETIKGVVSGSARASGSADELADATALADLRRTALEAAIDGAMRGAPEALRAAAQ